MATIRIRGSQEQQLGIYYEYDPSAPILGEGGMGKVFKGWCVHEHTGQRREVAIKFLYSDLPDHVIARARREAAVRIKHDSLVEMISFVETVDHDSLGVQVPRYHVVSEYLHGVALDKLLNGTVTDSQGHPVAFAMELYEQYRNKPYDMALRVVRSLLSGLTALHDAGYIHRDIDPSNIFITSAGHVKLIDFGIAKRVNGPGTNEATYTVKGQMIGKPRYAAPELVQGAIDSQNATTDLYAVGILLYQLVVGSLPFEGDMVQVMDMQLNRKMPLGNVKQKQLRAVIDKATRKRREQRFTSAAEFRVAVDRLVGLPYPAGAIGGGPDLRKVGIGAAAALVIAAAAVGISRMDFGPKQPEPTPTPTDDTELIARKDEPAPNVQPQRPAITYDQAIERLSSKSTAAEGVEMLQTLSNQGNAQAMLMLSRLYFNSRDNVSVGEFSKAAAKCRDNAALTPSNRKAHDLLVSAVKADPRDYRALFELGCDYKSANRGASVKPDSARHYFSLARQQAQAAGDQAYIQAIAARTRNL